MQDLMIRVVPVGMIRTNCYVLFLPGRSDCLVIDPGAEPEKLLKLIRDGVIDLNTLYGTNTEQQEGKKEEPKPEEAKAGEKKEEPNIEEAKAGEKKEEPKKEEPKPGTNGDAGKQEG